MMKYYVYFILGPLDLQKRAYEVPPSPVLQEEGTSYYTQKMPGRAINLWYALPLDTL